MKCKQCGKEHTRIKFCSNRCKDRFHNLHNPRGKFAHLKEVNHNQIDDIDSYHAELHPFCSGPDALGQD